MSKNKQQSNGYLFSKTWFDFALDNSDIVTGNHTALYLWLVELNNRLSWVEKFGISVREGMDGMSCKSRQTYSKCFKNLIDWGFVEMIKEGKNQYACNIIALVKNVQARVQHGDAMCASTSKSTGTHPQTVKPLNLETIKLDVVDEARAREIENSIIDFCADVKTENEEPKKVAPKKVLPDLVEVVAEMNALSYWRLVLEHHNQTTEDRQALFKIFYEQKEDNYKIRLPTWTDMAQHFYNWVPIHLAKPRLNLLNQNAKFKRTADRGEIAILDTFQNIKMNQKQ